MVRFHTGFSINPMFRLPQGCEEPPSADENRVCTPAAEGLQGKEKGPRWDLVCVGSIYHTTEAQLLVPTPRGVHEKTRTEPLKAEDSSLHIIKLQERPLAVSQLPSPVQTIMEHSSR